MRVIGRTKPKGEMKVKGPTEARGLIHPLPLRGRTAQARDLHAPSWAASTKSGHVGTRKMVNYAWPGRSQRKLWWRSVAILTCKSIVGAGYRGERLIEPSSSWFLSKFPSG